MAIKDILVHVSDAADSDGRLATAIALASRHAAHLTGIYTLWIPPMPTYVQSQLGDELLAQQRTTYLQMVAEVKSAFHAATAGGDVAVEWRCEEGEPVHALTQSARYCDLLITGRHARHDGDSTLHTVQHTVLQSGKPVLIMPDDGVSGTPGRHIMVAWNGRRESVRAIDSALPLLSAADRVDVIAVDARRGGSDAHGDIPAADLCRHLARHDVRAEAQSVDSGGHGAGETLLARAAADGVDLIVMGAYGHSRWREMVLGGATDHVLHHARIAVLMAH